MLPKTHILFGAIFTAVLWIVFPSINLFYLLLVFLSSFLIDFDHYIVAANKTKSLSLFKTFRYFELLRIQGIRNKKRGIRKKHPFMIFHTFEFHIIVLILGLYWEGFWFILLGMVFHSILDIIKMSYENELYYREFFFVNWVKRGFRN